MLHWDRSGILCILMVQSPETADRRPGAALALLAALLFMAVHAAPVGAWTATTQRAILARSLGTMPRSLRMVLTSHRTELYRASAAIPAGKGLLDPAYIAAECQAAVRMIREQKPFAVTAHQLGRVGALAAATADPYHAAAGSGHPAPSHPGFELFTERMLHLIPFVLDQEESARRDLLADRIDTAAYIRAGLELSATYCRDLESHVPGEARGPDPWAAYDARSTPFGVASVSVSRAACRVSTLWQWIWERAGGASAAEAF